MTLEVEVFGRNLEISERIQDYVEKKVSKLDRYLSDIEVADGLLTVNGRPLPLGLR